MKILVAGAGGFIGSSLSMKLLKRGDFVVGIDNLNSFYDPKFKKENISELLSYPRFIFRKVNIVSLKNLREIFNEFKFDKIVHLAALAGVGNSIENPNYYIRNNVNGTLNLLDLAKDYGVKQFIFASSSSVYGNTNSIPFKESLSINRPLNPYAMSKISGENLCYVYHTLYDLNITIFRFFTVYGPKGRPDMAPYIFTEAMLKNRPVTIFGDGNVLRDFTNINDIVDGIILGLDIIFGFNILNLGASSPVKIIEFIKNLENIISKKASIKFLSKKNGEMLATYADITKVNKDLGYVPKVSLNNGLNEFVCWFKEKRLKHD